MNDGALQSLRDEYEKKIAWIRGLGLDQRSSIDAILKDLDTAHEDVDSDLNFIHSGMYT